MVELAFRAATPGDATFIADVMTAARPQSPVDPILQRYWMEVGSDAYLERWSIIERDARPVGYGYQGHARWDLVPERYATVGGDLLPASRTPERLDAVYAAMEERARADGAGILRARANEDDPLKIGVILGRGYVEDRRGRRWELDLVANRERLLAMTEECRARMRAEGVRLLTLAEERDPDKYAKVHRMSEEAKFDVPTTEPHFEESLDEYMKWFRAPDLREDRFWIARLGVDIVGCSVLGYPPVRGVVGTHWTATARSVRGRGVARALKCETVAQAITLGVDRIRTGNDAKNDPILHLNETMGYRPIAGAIEFLKSA